MARGEGVVDFDTTIDEVIPVEIPKVVQQEKKARKSKVYEEEDKPLINCLRNERVVVRFIKKPTGLVDNPKHVLYGGMADTAVRILSVPTLSNGNYKNILTESEKDYLENILGLEPNGLSMYNRDFWKDRRIRLTKHDNFFNLSDPDDYINYKILLANTRLIAPSLQVLEERPKATYEFVITSENDEANKNVKDMRIGLRASMLVGTILEDKAALKYLVETIQGKPIASHSKLDYLQAQAFKAMQLNPKLVVSIIEDPLFQTKIFIKACLEYKIIKTRGDLYYSSDMAPLCRADEEPTLNVAARYINLPQNQELKLSLEAKLQQLKE